MNDLSIFNFDDKAVRTHMDAEGNPWWVAKDVCEVLELGNTSQALTRLEDDEKDDIISNDTIGRQQQVTIINEYGLYTLVLSSKKPQAKKFKRWITHEVIPTIRKTGQYSFANKYIVQAYITELKPWEQAFPEEFFKCICKLMDWPWRPGLHSYPSYMGKLILELVYDALPPGVREEIDRINPSNGSGRKHNMHQYLSETGRKHLEQHLNTVIDYARIFNTIDDLKNAVMMLRHKKYGLPVVDRNQLSLFECGYTVKMLAQPPLAIKA